MNDIDKLSRCNIQNLTPYQSARRIGGKGDVWLNANEYPESPSLQPSPSLTYNRYPEPQPKTLLRLYADYTNLSFENILVSRGADEGIELLIRVFCESEDEILICPPTYGMYEVSAKTCGVGVAKVPLKEDFQLDLDGIQQAISEKNIKLIFICSPNNPSGNLMHATDIETVLAFAEKKCLVVLDEAYIEFSPEASFIKKLNQYPNLVILRTLSKAFALAGLRVGFTLSAPQIIHILQKVIAPYPIPTIVANVAEQALSTQGIADMHQRVIHLKNNRQTLAKALLNIPYVEKIFDGEGNWLLIKVKDSEHIFHSLWNKGIILRHQTTQMRLENCIRISIGTAEENQSLINALKELS